jgi:hypothetical protein
MVGGLGLPGGCSLRWSRRGGRRGCGCHRDRRRRRNCCNGLLQGNRLGRVRRFIRCGRDRCGCSRLRSVRQCRHRWCCRRRVYWRRGQWRERHAGLDRRRRSRGLRVRIGRLHRQSCRIDLRRTGHRLRHRGVEFRQSQQRPRRDIRQRLSEQRRWGCCWLQLWCDDQACLHCAHWVLDAMAQQGACQRSSIGNRRPDARGPSGSGKKCRARCALAVPVVPRDGLQRAETASPIVGTLHANHPGERTDTAASAGAMQCPCSAR